MIIDPKTYPITLEAFKTITNSNGEYATWTDIITNSMDSLAINPELFRTPIKSFEEVIGDNITLQNTENKNIYLFDNDLNKKNNTLTLDKWVMYLYSDYMEPLEYSVLDRKSAVEWSQILSEALSSLAIARRDISNAVCLKEVMDVALAIGNAIILPDIDQVNADFLPSGELNTSVYKNAMRLLERFMQTIDRKRGKFQKGFDRNIGGTLISPQASLNFLFGKTYGSASDDAYKAMVKESQVYEYLGQGYIKSMYLGDKIGLSEFTFNTTTYNAGQNTGNLVTPFDFSKLHIQYTYTPSVAFYGHTYGEETRDKTGTRADRVWTRFWRMDAAIKPVYGRLNYSFFSEIPKFESWTDVNGKVWPAYDLSKAADFNNFRNDVYKRQPGMYNAWLDGTSALTQEQVDAIWAANTLEWKKPTTINFNMEETIFEVQRALVNEKNPDSWNKILGVKKAKK